MKVESGPSFAKRERPKNVTELETSNAAYRIIYSIHTIPNDPEPIKNADAVILEWAVDYSEHAIKRASQYAAIFKEAAAENIPIYFVDMSEDLYDKLEGDRNFDMKKYIAVAEAALGMHLVGKANQMLSRRDFLKAAVLAPASIYLLQPIAKRAIGALGRSMNTQEPDESSISRNIEKGLGTFQNKVHPELRTIREDTRNDLIAQKSESVAEIIGKKIGRKPKIGVVVGATHEGIEKSFHLDKRKRLERLEKDLGSDLKNESKIVEMRVLSFSEGDQAKVSIKVFHDIDIENN